MKSHAHSNRDGVHLQPPNQTNASRRITPDPTFLEAINSISTNPIRLSLMHISNLSHSSLDSEPDSSSLYSSDFQTIDITDHSPPQHRALGSRGGGRNKAHTKQGSLALADPVFVKAIDDMTGNPFRLSLMKFDGSVVAQDGEIVEKRRSDASTLEKGTAVNSTASMERAIYVSMPPFSEHATQD